MADQYIFVASGDACGICASLNGQVSSEPIGLPHDGCLCQVIPLGDGDCPTYEYSATTRRYGPHGDSFAVGLEVTVHCCDGSDISESTEIEMGNEATYGDDVIEAIDARADYAATALASQCREPVPNV